MRTYILTPHEKEIVEEFLKTGKKLNGFRVLIIRARDSVSGLRDDLGLIERLIEATDQS